jgi:hypothetical protein
MTEPCPCCSVMVVKDLNRWFKEKWVDVSRKDKDGKHPPCGRSKAKTSSKGYPKCRPSVKVSSKTPKTSGSMTEGQKRAATKRKRSKKQGVGGKPTIVKSLVLKRPVSPEAKRHKLEYDTKYESTPERLKYREELKRERRHRGIDGKGGPDMSHTKDHTLVAEDPHTNRARHFKERGTLKGDPMDIAWLLLKFDLDQRSPDDMDEFERREEDLMRQFNRQRTPEQTLSRGQLRRLEQSRPARGQTSANIPAGAGRERMKRVRQQAEQLSAERRSRELDAQIDKVTQHPGAPTFYGDRRRPTKGMLPFYGTSPQQVFNTNDIGSEAGFNVGPVGAHRLPHEDVIQSGPNVPKVTITPQYENMMEQIDAEGFRPSPEVNVLPSMDYAGRLQEEPTFQGIPFGGYFTTGEPMDLSFRLLKGEW